MIPENNKHTGAGATACASANQKWNGTRAALTRNPVQIHKRTDHQLVGAMPAHGLG